MFDPGEFVIGGVFDVYVADVGTAFPTDPGFVDADEPDWMHLGLTTEAGARFTFDLSVTRINSSQRLEPQRIIRTQAPRKVEYDLQQWNEWTLDLALGGIDVTSPSGGVTRLSPKASSFINEKALVVRATDGDEHWLVAYPRTVNTKASAFTWSKTAEAALPIGSEVLGTTGEAPYYIDTDATLAGS